MSREFENRLLYKNSSSALNEEGCVRSGILRILKPRNKNLHGPGDMGTRKFLGLCAVATNDSL